jgi:hypothetical protein
MAVMDEKQTQKNINERISKIITNGVPFSSDDKTFLLKIIQHHPSKTNLENVEKVFLNKSGDGLMIQYSDSSIDSISYKKCVRAMLGGKPIQNIREALRNEIYVAQILPFRKQNNMYGKGIEYHVGHGCGDLSFDAIVKQFCKENCLIEENIKLEKKRVKDYYECRGYFIHDRKLADKWKLYHKKFSNLIMQTAEENLRQKI